MHSMYIGGHIVPDNKKGDRIDHRQPENQDGKRQFIMAMREHRSRTASMVVPGKLSAVSCDLVKRYVDKSTSLRASEHSLYNDLLGLFPVLLNIRFFADTGR